VTDVVEQGGPERPSLPPWVRLVALAALAAAAVVWLSNGLLSADAPERSAPSPSTPEASAPSGSPATGEPPDTFEHVFVVVRDGDRLVRYDEFGVFPGPDLPPAVPPGREVTVVDYPTGSEVLVTAAAGRLYRMDPLASQVTDVAAAAAVVGDATGTGNAFVQVERGVVVMDVRSGEVVDGQPFADVPRTYRPVGVLSLFGVEGLLLQRHTGSGPALAVSWAADAVRAGARPAFQPLPGGGTLLGLTGEWVLRLRGPCPGPDCRLLITGFAGEQPSVREVRPPDGWSFTAYRPGVLRGPLVPVVPLDPGQADGAPALARLAAGGDSALLVPSTTGLVPDAGIVEQHDGDVVFVRLGREGIRRAYAWTPDRAGEVRSAGNVPPLPQTARLVCICT
jgi:hypothetical protein